jgi:D-beta-D-heptose 7-phosphate kinase / D-beta-D-heptose 1-phosphate adenosyltransferase
MEEKARSLIEEFVRKDLARKCQISVIGDIMLDEYHEVTVDRISPEFPIPVMKSRHDNFIRVPGGAANVALQFSQFNIDVYLTGMTNQVMPLMSNNVFDHSPCIKKRFYQGNFPVSRWDIEEPCYGINPDAVFDIFDDWDLKKTDVTVFSDYNKGIFSKPWYRHFLSDRLTIVDPKNDLARWQGCTILKPNSVEAKALTGENDWRRQAEKLIKTVKCQSVVITQGSEGVVGLTPDGFFEYRPSRKDEVNSVIGAGDCFVAFLAMAIAHGMSTYEASVVAYEAGAVYVQSKHNRPLKPAELLARKCGSQVVFTNGCFDLLHAGHIQTLEFAKNQGDLLVVGVNSDESVRRLKGNSRPLNKLADRIRVLSAMKCVDCVVPFDSDTPLDLIRYVRPDIIVKAADYRPENVVGGDLAKVVIAPFLDGLSTTNLIQKSQLAH